MDVDVEELPADVAELQRLLLMARAGEEQYRTENKSLRAENAALLEKLRLARTRLFGSSSEKFADEQQARLFNEAEVAADAKAPAERVRVNGHSRKKGGRRALPDYLPRKESMHDIDAAEKRCGCGAELVRIGEEVTEKLEIIPADIFVERHIRPKYACARCRGEHGEEEAVKIAPAPPQILPKSMAGPGLLAYLAAGKFVDALPFYRQELIFRNRLEIDLGRGRMCSWMIDLSRELAPLEDFLREELLSYPLLQCDETTLQVLNEPGRRNTTKSYMWVLRGGPPERPVLIYQYRETRGVDFLRTMLADYRGVLLTDGYGGYDALGKALPDITQAGCWDHARRPFAEIIKTVPGSPAAAQALELIRPLYKIEEEARRAGLDQDGVRALRQEKSAPLLLRLHAFLEDQNLRSPPRSLLGQAVRYALGQWPKLMVYLSDGRVPISNVIVENDIRPFVIGRKNWLFGGSPRGAQASALLYTLTRNAVACGIEPFSYLHELFRAWPLARSDRERRALLPQFIDRTRVKSIR